MGIMVTFLIMPQTTSVIICIAIATNTHNTKTIATIIITTSAPTL